MSIRKRYITFGDIATGFWLMHPSIARGYFPAVLKMMKGDIPDVHDDVKDFLCNNLGSINFPIANSNTTVTGYFISEYGDAAPPEQAPPNSVAIISLKGAMTKYDQWCGPAGTETKRELLQRCFSNPNILGVVFDVDSGGGQSNEGFNSDIANAPKPVVFSISGYCCSAALWAASCGIESFVSGKSSVVGSIGSYVEIADFTKAYEMEGINIIRTYAPQSTLKNKSYEDILKGDDEELKKELKQYTDFFIDAVKANRPEIKDDGKVFKGKTYFSEDAIAMGLVDKAGDLKDAILRVHELNPPTQKTNSFNKQSNNTTMFGMFPKVNALKGKKAEEITEEMISAANGELAVNGINSVVIVTGAQLEAAQNTIAQLTAEKNTLQTANTALTAENTTLKNADGAEPINVKKDKDEVTEDPAKVNSEKIAKLPHNKAAAEFLDR